MTPAARPAQRHQGVSIVTSFIEDKAVIVVAVDYSQNSNDALRLACGLAGGDVSINLVHVTRTSRWHSLARMSTAWMTSTNVAPVDELRVEKKELETLTQRVAALVAASGARLYGHLRSGNASREILQLASDLSANLIVVGMNRRTGLKRLLLQSVAKNVATNASCPVLIVKAEDSPRWSQLQPPCPECVAVQQSSLGQRLWCDRRSSHRARSHTYSAHSGGHGLNTKTFRGLSWQNVASSGEARRA